MSAPEGEGNEVSGKTGQLKMLAPDGKKRLTDAADVETVLRLIQSIPSPKAEPFKPSLAKVGYERMQETIDPELGLSRARHNWLSCFIFSLTFIHLAFARLRA